MAWRSILDSAGRARGGASTLVKSKPDSIVEMGPLPAPTPWPNANARLLGLGVGLPVKPLDRLALFNDVDFERFTLEWATDYLSKQKGVFEVQQRGASGDKGRDIVVWLDAPDVLPRRWHLYQCKHLGSPLGSGGAMVEIGKVLHYTSVGEYTAPDQYWFVTSSGVTSPLQDLLDNPNAMRQFVVDKWDEYCAKSITKKQTIGLTDKLKAHINAFDFSIFRAKQPHELVEEHAHTRYHLAVFGAPLVDRPPPPQPPSAVAATEIGYITQLYKVIAQELGAPVHDVADFSHSPDMQKLFQRSRLTFYSAEGLKELARDQIADARFFDTLLNDFHSALYHAYTDPQYVGLRRLRKTVLAAQSVQLGAHVLEPHTTPNDREGACHQLANDGRIYWCAT